MDIRTVLLATMAEERHGQQQDMGLFGHFKAADICGEHREMAFTASRYAYLGSPLCLNIWTADKAQDPIWEPYISFTKNIRPNDCKEDEVAVKTYDENEHLREVLLNLGYFVDTGKRIRSGFVKLEIWKITEKFVHAFKSVHSELETA